MTQSVETKEQYLFHFQRLKTIQNNLRNNTEPDLDKILDQVNQAMESYNVCKTRIDSVSQLLEQKLQTTKSVEEPPSE